MEELTKKYHKGQYRNREDVPYTEHLVGVAATLSAVLGITGEADAETREIMREAALGHDLIEDTAVTEAEIVEVGGEKVLRLIQELSNPVDDAHTEAYMEQLKGASEEARIVKYCDLVENTTSVCYALHETGLDWAREFYLPILENSTKTLEATEFSKFLKTAEILRTELKVATEVLRAKMETFGK